MGKTASLVNLLLTFVIPKICSQNIENETLIYHRDYYGMTLYCSFATHKQLNYLPPIKDCFRKNKQMTHYLPDGTPTHPYVATSADSFILECPVIQGGRLNNGCTKYIYTKCTLTCEGSDIIYPVQCNLKGPWTNVTAEWSIQEPGMQHNPKSTASIVLSESITSCTSPTTLPTTLTDQPNKTTQLPLSPGMSAVKKLNSTHLPDNNWYYQNQSICPDHINLNMTVTDCSESDFEAIYISAAVGGITAAAGLIVTIVCLCQRRRRKHNDDVEISEVTLFTNEKKNEGQLQQIPLMPKRNPTTCQNYSLSPASSITEQEDSTTGNIQQQPLICPATDPPSSPLSHRPPGSNQRGFTDIVPNDSIPNSAKFTIKESVPMEIIEIFLKDYASLNPGSISNIHIAADSVELDKRPHGNNTLW